MSGFYLQDNLALFKNGIKQVVYEPKREIVNPN